MAGKNATLIYRVHLCVLNLDTINLLFRCSGRGRGAWKASSFHIRVSEEEAEGVRIVVVEIVVVDGEMIVVGAGL